MTDDARATESSAPPLGEPQTATETAYALPDGRTLHMRVSRDTRACAVDTVPPDDKGAVSAPPPLTAMQSEGGTV